MSKQLRLSLFVGLFALLAIGCGNGGSRRVGVTSYQPNMDIPDYAKRDTRPPITQPKDEDIRKTGTGEWNTGRATQPQPKALEKTFLVRGTVSAVGGNSITVTAEGGGARTFQTDENTYVHRTKDPRFFAIPGGAGAIPVGSVVSVQGRNTNGQDYASRIGVGEGDFSEAELPKKK